MKKRKFVTEENINKYKDFNSTLNINNEEFNKNIFKNTMFRRGGWFNRVLFNHNKQMRDTVIKAHNKNCNDDKKIIITVWD